MADTKSEEPEERSTEERKTISLDDVTLKDEYQTNRELHEEEISGLQRSVREGGIDSSELPVVDTDNNVVNGQHRVEAFRNEGYDETEFVVMEFESESAKKDYAYSRNASGRHLDGGEKREMVRNYLMEEHVSSDVPSTEVAEFLSVSDSTVSRARKQLRQDSEVEKFSGENLSKEEKYKKTKEYIRENPNDSNREVAENVPYSHSTVGMIREEVEDENKDKEVGANEVENLLNDIGELRPATASDPDEVEDLKSRTNEALEELDDEVDENLKERTEELFDQWTAHAAMASYSHLLQCPVCGEDTLEYGCCEIGPDDAYDLAQESYQNHLDMEEELGDTDYPSEEESDWRGFEGKEEAPTFGEILNERKL